MAQVVFFRAVNVGGYQRFEPAALARDLAALDVVSIGAAGTFVVRSRIGEAALRKEFLRRLPFQPDMSICPASEIERLIGLRPEGPADGIQVHATAMEKPPRHHPALPIVQPAGEKWQIKIVAVSGRFAIVFRRPLGPRALYPNPVVEKAFGVWGTTRNWNTIEKIHELIKEA